jgi:ribonuclease HI
MKEVENLALRLNISDWDLILVGDGSGNGWENPGGWGCYIFNKQDTGEILERPAIAGGLSCGGSISFLEAIPFWLAIRQHYYTWGGLDACAHGKIFSAHIVTDSEWAAKAMSGSMEPKKHKDMAMLFRYFQDLGYRITWHKVPREVFLTHKKADRLSAQAREYIAGVESEFILEDSEDGGHAG